MIERIETAIKLIDETHDISSIGSDRAEYFEWATDQLIKLITKIPIADCGIRPNIVTCKPEDQPFYDAESAWFSYSDHYFISELIQACINQGEWNLLPNILSPSYWKIFDPESRKYFDLTPMTIRKQKDGSKERRSWSLESIIKYPTTWNWGIKFFVEIE